LEEDFSRFLKKARNWTSDPSETVQSLYSEIDWLVT